VLEGLPRPPIDPILAFGSIVRAEMGPDKIDLAIGVYRDESGRTPIMAAVVEAERRLLVCANNEGFG
jgi:aspartate aminotransferase